MTSYNTPRGPALGDASGVAQHILPPATAIRHSNKNAALGTRSLVT
ncbi:hypothetical protein I6A84_17195 [Frankia sp. CNm7]|uniref:Uncharacterized protein n=1 Tax=Frankia nepalensis TaxID=1836974 RepID=A0A937UN16_9ACTN|nr:hypothetical protein [Frankia nepalensis]MBL7502469.1 hypothetical protein [Frankia nepalensis]MBL7516359.1 hypothetical protein [Frankia nepalensis]MBL7519786.1 hypothetical protein [Frankia nepalensis]MBL7625785.1 hypothetical protein [Frankia nepalensis]